MRFFNHVLGIHYNFRGTAKEEGGVVTCDHDGSSEDFDETEKVDLQDISETITLPERKRFHGAYVVIEGALKVAELIDYLINQKDLHSYAILPEILAPGPFLYGTLMKNETTNLSPSSKNAVRPVHQIKIRGAVFPKGLNQLYELIKAEQEVELVSELNPMTDFLSTFPNK